jgi:hypothetical protein
MCEPGASPGIVDCVFTKCVPQNAGRRTADLRAPASPNSTRRGALFAALATAEAGSVLSFRRLRHELAAHGAPRRLLRAASRAARDEARHARVMGSFARRAGAPPSQPALDPGPVRPLVDVALENAIEGCVLETHAALVMNWQAMHAETSELRGALRRIARDEERHAVLAWAVAAWLEPRLSADERARVRFATRCVARRLRERPAGPGAPPPRAVAMVVTGLRPRPPLPA